MNEVPSKNPFRIDELDPPFSWEEPAPQYRGKMQTVRDFELRDEDIVEVDVDPWKSVPLSRPRRRESMPTLPDIDPLRHDLPS